MVAVGLLPRAAGMWLAFLFIFAERLLGGAALPIRAGGLELMSPNGFGFHV